MAEVFRYWQNRPALTRNCESRPVSFFRTTSRGARSEFRTYTPDCLVSGVDPGRIRRHRSVSRTTRLRRTACHATYGIVLCGNLGFSSLDFSRISGVVTAPGDNQPSRAGPVQHAPAHG